MIKGKSAIARLSLRGLDAPVIVQKHDPDYAGQSAIGWAVVGEMIVIALVAPDGTRITVQLDEHQLHAMSADLAELIRAMPPRSESERTLQ